jgi:hypothetical protein
MSALDELERQLREVPVGSARSNQYVLLHAIIANQRAIMQGLAALLRYQEMR